MNQQKDRFSLYLLLIIFNLLYSNWAFSLESDKEKTMHVLADSADLNQQKHKGTYKGNVAFNQGTTHLHAVFASTLGDASNKLVLAVAKGDKEQQAHYWTITDEQKPAFHAYADTIKYYPLKHLIELIGNARIEQGNNSLSAHRILYDTLKQHVVSESSGTTRTSIILNPEKNLL